MDNGAELTKKFIQKWETGDEGLRKQAVYAVNSYVRLKLRENGIVRSPLLPPLDLADGQLDKDENPAVLKKFMEIEPDSVATSVPFRGMPEAQFVKGKFVPVYFGKIEGKLHTVNIIELKNYSNDLRQILNEQDVKNLQSEEDVSFITRLNQIAAANPLEQDLEFWGGLTKINWALAQQQFFAERPIKYALMNIKTYKEFYKWDGVSDWGYGPYGAEVATQGKVPTPNGLNVIQTIKTTLVPDGVVFFFAPEDFIGKFFVLQPPTTFVEQKADWISFFTYEVVGIGIGNTKCFIKCTFHP